MCTSYVWTTSICDGYVGHNLLIEKKIKRDPIEDVHPINKKRVINFCWKPYFSVSHQYLYSIVRFFHLQVENTFTFLTDFLSVIFFSNTLFPNVLF